MLWCPFNKSSKIEEEEEEALLQPAPPAIRLAHAQRAQSHAVCFPLRILITPDQSIFYSSRDAV